MPRKPQPQLQPVVAAQAGALADVSAAVEYASAVAATCAAAESSGSFWKAAATGNLKALQEALDQGQAVDAEEAQEYIMDALALRDVSRSGVSPAGAVGVIAPRGRGGGVTALHIAAWHGHHAACALLLARGADANHLIPGGWSALHLSALAGHKGVCNLLLSYGAHMAHPIGGSDDLKRTGGLGQDEDGCAPNHVPRWYFLSCFFVSRGMDDVASYTYTPGWGPLHCAAIGGHVDVCKLLFAAGASPNERDARDKTPLHYAAGAGNREVCEFLLAAGADIHSRSIISESPLHCAVTFDRVHVCDSLIAHGADVNAATVDQLTPLCYAVEYGWVRIYTQLLADGAAVHTFDAQGRTPIMKAMLDDDEPACRALVAYGATIPTPTALTSAPVAPNTSAAVGAGSVAGVGAQGRARSGSDDGTPVAQDWRLPGLPESEGAYLDAIRDAGWTRRLAALRAYTNRHGMWWR